MSIVHAQPIYKRMGLDVIKSLWVGYMPQLTSMEGLRKNDIFLMKYLEIHHIEFAPFLEKNVVATCDNS